MEVSRVLRLSSLSPADRHLVMVGELVCFYAGWSLAPGRVIHAGQVKRPDEKRSTGPPGLGNLEEGLRE